MNPRFLILAAGFVVAGALVVLISTSRLDRQMRSVLCEYGGACGYKVPAQGEKARLTIGDKEFVFSLSIIAAASPSNVHAKKFHSVRLILTLPQGEPGGTEVGVSPRRFQVLVREGAFDPYYAIGRHIRDWKGRENAPLGTVYHHDTGEETVRELSLEAHGEMLTLPPITAASDLNVPKEYVLHEEQGIVDFVIECDRASHVSEFSPGPCFYSQNVDETVGYEVSFARDLLGSWPSIFHQASDLVQQSQAGDSGSE